MQEAGRLVASERSGRVVWGAALVALLIGVLATAAIGKAAAGGIGLVALGLLWAVVILFIANAMTTPTHVAVLEPDGTVRFVWQYPFRREVKHFRAAELDAPRITSDRDSDGDRHVGATLRLPDGSSFVIARPAAMTHQSAHREARMVRECVRRAERFCEAVGLPVPRAT